MICSSDCSAISGGNRVGEVQEKPNTLLVDGVFSVSLDFGNAYNSGYRFIEISIRRSGSPNVYVVLGSRQQILSVPTSARALSASQADTATIATTALDAYRAADATTAVSAARLNNIPGGEFVQRNVSNTGSLQMSGDIGAGGNLSVAGNAKQNTAAFGLPKAIILVQENGSALPATIRSCYNGSTGASTPETCGFTLTEPLGNGIGAYRIDFGFSPSTRFASVTPFADSTLFNFAASARNNGQFLEVFTYRTNSGNDTVRCSFTVIVY